MARRRSMSGPDPAHGQPQPPVEPAHPLGVPGGQVVVDRHHVDALGRPGRSGRRAGWRPGSCPPRSSSRRSSRSAGPCRPSAGRRSGAGRAPARHASRTTAKASTSRSSRSSPWSRRSLNSTVLWRSVVVAEGLHLRLEVVDQRDDLGQAADLLALAGPQDPGEHAHRAVILPVRPGAPSCARAPGGAGGGDPGTASGPRRAGGCAGAAQGPGAAGGWPAGGRAAHG